MTKEQYVVDTKGKKTVVVLPIKRYEQLMEDLHELAIVGERRDEEPISFQEIQKRLKRSGLL